MRHLGNMTKSNLRQRQPLETQCNWLERILPRWSKTFIKLVKASPMEAGLLFVAVGASITVYITWMIFVLPDLLKKASFINRLLTYFTASWIMYGILGHLCLICATAIDIPTVFIMPLDLMVHSELDLESETVGKEVEKVSEPSILAETDSEVIQTRLCLECKKNVPLLAWHCPKCETCVEDRNPQAHSCSSNGKYGTKGRKHVNFLGLLLYWGVGALSATIVGILRMDRRDPWWTTPGLFHVSNGVPAAAVWVCGLILDPIALCTGIVGIASMAMFAYFFEYAAMAVNKQKRSENLSNPDSSDGKQFWVITCYRHFGNFLGPQGIRQMLFPIICAAPTHGTLKPYVNMKNRLE